MSMRTIDASAYAQNRDEYQGQYADETPESISVIDRFSNFDGTFHSTRDLRIEGQVKGTIDCQGTLHIAQGANVDAKVDAENISVAGDLNGDITCRGRLQIMPSGRVHGKINTVTLVINEGAFYEGELEMQSAERRLSGRGGRGRSSLGSSGGGPVPIGSQGGEPARPASEAAPAAPPAQGTGNTFIRRFGGQETNWESNQPADDADDNTTS